MMRRLLGLGLLLTIACDDDDAGRLCRGDRCSCSDRSTCDVACPLGDCAVDCARADRCTTECGGACDIACHDTAACEAECGDGCALTCDRASRCALACGEACDVRCGDVSRCSAEVGSASRVECARLDHCDIACLGPCEVACREVARCDVRCPPGLQRCEGEGVVRCAASCAVPVSLPFPAVSPSP